MKPYSLAHILYIIICIGIMIGFYYFLKNKSHKFQDNTIKIVLFLGLIVHFLKLLIPYYRNNLPNSLISLTPETICASCTILFPFLYFSKKELIKDGVCILGILAGALPILLPGDVVSANIPSFDIETIRFFFAHLVFLFPSLLILLLKRHKLTNKSFKNFLIFFLMICLLLLVNALIFSINISFDEVKDALKGKI